MQYRSYYIVRWKPEYLDLLRQSLPVEEAQSLEPQMLIVSVLQGGFGEGVMNYVRKVKERFLERELEVRQVNLGLTEEEFDSYFELIEPDDVIDLEEE